MQEIKDYKFISFVLLVLFVFILISIITSAIIITINDEFNNLDNTKFLNTSSLGDAGVNSPSFSTSDGEFNISRGDSLSGALFIILQNLNNITATTFPVTYTINFTFREITMNGVDQGNRVVFFFSNESYNNDRPTNISGDMSGYNSTQILRLFSAENNDPYPGTALDENISIQITEDINNLTADIFINDIRNVSTDLRAYISSETRRVGLWGFVQAGGNAYHFSLTNLNYTADIVNIPTFDSIADFSINEDFGSLELNPFDNFTDLETIDSLVNWTVTSNDSNAVTLDFSLMNGTGNLTLYSIANISGATTINITGYSETAEQNSTEFILTINSVNDAPTTNGTLGNSTRNEDFGTLNDLIPVADFNANWSDVEDSTPTTYTIIFQTNTSTSCYLDGSNNLDCESNANLTGEDYYTFELNDSGNLGVRYGWNITVNAVNDKPFFNQILNISVNEDFNNFDSNLSDNVTDVEDIDSLLVYDFTSNNSGIVTILIDNSTGNMSFVPVLNQFGDTTINITVRDTGNEIESTEFILTINAVNDQAPDIDRFVVIPGSCDYNDVCILNAEVSDIEGDFIVSAYFSLLAPNGSVLFENINGTFTVINGLSNLNWSSPSFIIDDSGVYKGNITVADNELTNSSNIDITIVNNVIPYISLEHPENNSANLTSSNIEFSIIAIDDVTSFGSLTCWIEFNQSGVNETLNSCNNFTRSIVLDQDQNISLYVNDSSGNENQTGLYNFTSVNDTSSPSIVISSPTPSETFTGTTPFNITLTTSISDNVLLDKCWFEVPLEGIVNTTYDCISSSFEVNSYGTRIIFVYANDSVNNVGRATQTISTQQTVSSSGGGGGSSPTDEEAFTCNEGDNIVWEVKTREDSKTAIVYVDYNVERNIEIQTTNKGSEGVNINYKCLDVNQTGICKYIKIKDEFVSFKAIELQPHFNNINIKIPSEKEFILENSNFFGIEVYDEKKRCEFVVSIQLQKNKIISSIFKKITIPLEPPILIPAIYIIFPIFLLLSIVVGILTKKYMPFNIFIAFLVFLIGGGITLFII